MRSSGVRFAWHDWSGRADRVDDGEEAADSDRPCDQTLGDGAKIAERRAAGVFFVARAGTQNEPQSSFSRSALPSMRNSPMTGEGWDIEHEG